MLTIESDHTYATIAHARCFCALVTEDMPLASIVWPAVPLDVAVAAMRRRKPRHPTPTPDWNLTHEPDTEGRGVE